MSSSSEINANYPIPGLTQSSKGFRDNFALIKEQLEGIESTQFQIVGAIESNVGYMNGDGTTVILEIPENNLENAVVQALNTLNIALVPWVSNTFAFFAGDSTQTFNVAIATNSTEAVNMQLANILISESSSNFLPISGGVLENTAPGNGSLTATNIFVGNSLTFNNAVGTVSLPNQNFLFLDDGSFSLPVASTNPNAAVQYQQLVDMAVPLAQLKLDFAAINGSAQENFAANSLSVYDNILVISNEGLGSAEIYSDMNNDLVFGHGKPNTDGSRPYYTVCREDGQFILAAPAVTPSAAPQLGQIQSGTSMYAVDTSTTVNKVVISLSPAPIMLVDGQPIRFKAAKSNTGATTITVNELSGIPLNTAAGAMQGGEIVAGALYEGCYNATTNTVVIIGSGGGAVAGASATQSNQYTTLGQFPYSQSSGYIWPRNSPTPNQFVLLGLPGAGESSTLLVQIGSGTIMNSGQYYPFAFPFPNECLYVIGCDVGDGLYTYAFWPASRFGMTVFKVQQSQGWFQYIAFGR